MTQSGIEPAQALAVGFVVRDTYQVTRLLGRGGMGSVWEAIHLRLPGKRVAIKVLHADVAADQEALARFRREAEIASRLAHPNIVEVHDFDTLPDGQPYLVLELLVGESLDGRLRRAPMSLDGAFRVAGQIASGLAAAHRAQVIHRDLKPQNVFLVQPRADSDEDGGDLVKVLDFGISKIRGSQTVKTLDSTILGTPQYMAPEQATGNHAAVDQRTDVFALGAIVYEMLAGRPAFTGQSIPEVVFKVVYEAPPALTELVPGLPPRVSNAIERALSKKQDDRFPDVVSFIEEMAGVSLSTLRRAPLSISALSMAVVPTTPSSDGAATPGPDAAGPDALAATVDSGRRDLLSIPPPAGATDRSGAPGAHRVIRRDLVSRSGGDRSGRGAESDPGEERPDVDAWPVTERTAATPAQRSTMRRPVLLGSIVLALALGAAGIWLASSGDDPAPTPAIPAVTKRPPSATTIPTADPPTSRPAPSDADLAVAAVDPGTSKRPRSERERPAPSVGEKSERAQATPHTRTPRGNAPAVPPGEDPGAVGSREEQHQVRESLRQGEQALDSGDHRAALFHAERALRRGGGAGAHALRARAACAFGDLGTAKASFLRIPRRNVIIRRRVLSVCARNGHDVGP